jgi:hypothetical protein
LKRQNGKVLVVLMLALMLAGALGGYWYFNPDQQPNWLASRMPTAPDAEVTLYRWQAADGEWIVSGEPPPEGVEYEIVNYRHDANVMPPVKTEDEN